MSLNFKKIGIAFLLLISTSAVSQQAFAYGYWHPGYHSGRWVYDRHEGRLGWWWVGAAAGAAAATTWAFYPRPYPVYPPQTVVIQQVPAPQPQVVVEQAPPQLQPQQQVVQASPVLYYCKSTETYYPDTMTCPGGWSTMMAGSPPAAMTPPTAPVTK
jgi:hypothetical protein